ncbi:TIGR04282 family arsenosugar biosynthesis glycosyltransferase [Flavitalea sp.]|nr:TIGR04282 family arsenosugar biosynthesis glycosyltransferase [Flavitalea sp.]
MDEALIIFTKNPIHGQVKTRLATTIGNDKALAVYKQLIHYTIEITDQLPVPKFIFYSDSIEPDDNWSNNIYSKKLQSGAGLGEKMKNAFSDLFTQGYSRVLIIGTDCPELSPAIITAAFDSLNNHDIVIGPARDGGYYLLGMKKLYPGLFDNISWSTDQVLQQTLLACAQSRLSNLLMEELSDIDTEKDLLALKPLNEWIYD